MVTRPPVELCHGTLTDDPVGSTLYPISTFSPLVQISWQMSGHLVCYCESLITAYACITLIYHLNCSVHHQVYHSLFRYPYIPGSHAHFFILCISIPSLASFISHYHSW